MKATKCNIVHVSRKVEPSSHVYLLKAIPLEAFDLVMYLGIKTAVEIIWHEHSYKVLLKRNKVPGCINCYVYTNLIRIRIYLLARRNLLWDILRLPSSRRAALDLHVILTL